MTRSRDPAAQPPPGFVLVGTITGTHGRAGRVRVAPESDNPDRYRAGGVLHVDGEPYVIEGATPAGDGYLVKLRGVDDSTTAEALVGRQTLAPKSSVPPAAEHTYYHYQLLDLVVRTAAGERLGVLTDVLSTGANDVYVVTGDGVELLLPALDSVVVAVDLDRAEMVVNVPEGVEPRALTARPKRTRARRAGGRSKRAPA